MSEKEIENRMRPRIEELREAALEEESEGLGQLPLSDDSYRGLINFLKRVSDSGIEAVPGLALTYEGNIVAEWESSPDEVLSLEFLDSSSLKPHILLSMFRPCGQDTENFRERVGVGFSRPPSQGHGVPAGSLQIN